MCVGHVFGGAFNCQSITPITTIVVVVVVCVIDSTPQFA